MQPGQQGFRRTVQRRQLGRTQTVTRRMPQGPRSRSAGSVAQAALTRAQSAAVAAPSITALSAASSAGSTGLIATLHR